VPLVAVGGRDLPDDAGADLDRVYLVGATLVGGIRQQSAAGVEGGVALVAGQVDDLLLMGAVRAHEPEVEVGILRQCSVNESVAIGVLAVADKGDAVLADDGGGIGLELL